ncbi:hypothetical protein DRW03_02515 [Corallococcus sp. H22C18031201]|nr:hypothetical protein DRW03_02515 [Corallococcus sp. H22C18031201]
MRALLLGLILAAVAGAAWQRDVAVRRLPPDYDELTYLPVAYRYEAMLASGRWGEVATFRENFEHPPLVKLLFATGLWVSGAPEPEWKQVEVGHPLPAAAVPVFHVTRGLSAVMGVLQVALVAVVSAPGALLLAFDAYHAKYTSQAYLEAVPGLLAVLAVLAFERARRTAPGSPRAFRRGPLVLSGALLGAAAACKYPYGLVVGLALAPFLGLPTRARLGPWGVFGLATLAAFFLLHPGLWSSPVGNLWESVSFHWSYSQSAHVQRAGLPWYQPWLYLTHPEPVSWHDGVFLTGASAWLMVPLAVLGVPRAARTRPVWLAWAGVGLVFLMMWPTRWPQYLLLVLPALSVCAGLGVETLAAQARRSWRRRAGLALPPTA